VIPLRDENPTSRPAVVTALICLACALVYFLVQPSPMQQGSADVAFELRHAVIPREVRDQRPLTRCEVATTYSSPATARSECNDPSGALPFAKGKNVLLAIVVSLFLHGSIGHLLGNLLLLWIFGNNVEDGLGRLRYLAFYVIVGIVATTAYVVVNPTSTTTLVGASGAIAGVMGTYLVWFPRAPIRSLIVIVPVRLPAWVLLAFWFGLQFFTSSDSQVAWVAHVAGFVFGVVAGVLLRNYRPRPVGLPRYR
jgi:membrane associated rhomboid family serine protease